MTRAFTHGLTGNVTLDDKGGNATTLTYNSTGRLVQVSAGAITLVDYVYAADGQRAVKATPTATTHYLYDPGGALYAETDGAGTVLREYVTLGGVTLAVIDGLGTSYVHNDHLSTGQKMTGDGGAVVWDASYRPFGEATITAAAASLNQRFPGQYADAETGYSDNWNRTYDPSLGRYLQSDPIGLAGGLNMYGYAGGNPLIRFDRRGLDWRDDARFYGGIALATVAVIALAPELAMVAATGWAIGTVGGALGIMGVQYAVGGWCNVDKDLLGMVAEEAAWTVGTAGAGALLKVGRNLWKARRAADDSTRVGRWMSPKEHAKMMETGKVQESVTGTTHVAHPADPEAFIKQAKVNSNYVEFDVPASSVTQTGDNWGKVIGPNSVEGRLASRKGNPVPQMPEAQNIEHLATKYRY